MTQGKGRTFRCPVDFRTVGMFRDTPTRLQHKLEVRGDVSMTGSSL